MPAHHVLQSWKQIADYVGRTERTLQRWERDFGFPVHRPSGKSRSAVMALTEEIQEWTRGRPSLVQIRRVSRLNRARLVATPGDQNSGSHGTQSSVLQLPARRTPEFSDHEFLRSILFERSRVSGLLWEKQRVLRRDVTDRLAEQRRLRTQLRSNRERRLASVKPKQTQPAAVIPD